MAKKGGTPETFVKGAEEYVARIRNRYELLSEAEREVADYFLRRAGAGGEVPNIKEVARDVGTSVATVMRFCKALGFSGFSEFKFALQSGVLAPVGGAVQIGSRDDMGVIKQKVAEYARRTISTSIPRIDNRELERAVLALEKCSRMTICAAGTAGGVAMSTANTFMAMGIPCYTVADPLTMLRTVSFCDARDVVIGITSCGHIKQVVDALKVAKERGAVTICVTAARDSLVARYADIVLHCTLKDNSIALDLITVSMCQLLTLQTLQVGYLSRRSDAVAKQISEHYSLSEMTRYGLDVECVEDGRVRF